MKFEHSRWLTLLWQIIIGSVTCFSYIITVFLGPLHDKFGWEATTVIFAFTLSMWVGTPANIVGGWLRDKFGCKKCIIGSGVIYGLSIALSGIVSNVWFFVIIQGIVAPTCMFICYIAALANIGTLFPEKRGFATGLYVGGYSLGSAVLSPIAESLIRHFSVSFSIIAEGIVYGIIVIVLGFLIIDPKEPLNIGENTVEDTEPKLESGPQVHWKQMIKMPSYYLILATFLLAGIIGFVAIGNGAMVAEQAVGASSALAAWIVSIINIGAGVGGFVFGFVADKKNATFAIMVVVIIQSIACIIFTICGMNNVPVFICAIATIGLTTGGCGTLLPVITMNTFGEKFFGVNMGLVSIQTIFATLIGPQLSVRCDIWTVFLIGGITSVAAIFALLITKRSIRKLCAIWNDKNA